jgi:thiaminase/transcriptional activator TenA
MKSPRRITLTPEMVAKHNLSTAPPPPDSLFWTMWNACTDVAAQALQTPFIQGIKAGTLDPVKYGGFNVNDAWYCFNGADDYRSAANRADDPALKAFLNEKRTSYEKYNATFPQVWRVRDGASIVPYDVCRKYSDFERRVASSKDAIYAVVVMLPCEYLWAWLGAQLSPASPQNLYASWINDNNYTDGPYAMGNFLNEYQQAQPGLVDPKKALDIYRRAMEYEQRNFAAATS